MLETLLGFLASFLANFLRGWLSDKRAADAQREAGASSVIIDTLKKNQDALAEAMKAEIEADHRHKTMPGDQAFDQDFRRD